MYSYYIALILVITIYIASIKFITINLDANTVILIFIQYTIHNQISQMISVTIINILVQYSINVNHYICLSIYKYNYGTSFDSLLDIS